MVQLLLNFFPGYPTSAGAQADTKSTVNLSGNDDLSDNQNDQVNIASLLMDSYKQSSWYDDFPPIVL